MIYTRWGRTECPSGTTDLYIGLVGGTWYNDDGGVSNLFCLTDDPTYIQTGQSSQYSYIYSTEYESDNQVFPGNTNMYLVLCVLLNEAQQL